MCYHEPPPQRQYARGTGLFQREYDQMLQLTTDDVLPEDMPRLMLIRGFLYVARRECIVRSVRDLGAETEPMIQQILLSIYETLSTTGNIDILHCLQRRNGEIREAEERAYSSTVMDAIVFCIHSVYKDVVRNARQGSSAPIVVAGIPVDDVAIHS